MPLNAGKGEAFAALAQVTRLLAECLCGVDPERASDAGEQAHRLLDVSIRANPASSIPDCAKGCSHCCHGRVTASAPEIFALARAIRGLDPEPTRRFLERLQLVAGLTSPLRAVRACPLLDHGACSLHHLRPGACRGMSSHSEPACRAAFARGRPQEAPRVREHAVLRAMHAQALWAALRAAGLPNGHYDLAEGLLRALNTADAERRWLEGEDVFEGLAVDHALADLPEGVVESTTAELASATAERSAPMGSVLKH
ncbi:MAG: YkgJ family cysteine cluster protein [Phenylobacterium sp.]